MVSIEGKHLMSIYDGLLGSGSNRFDVDTKPLASGNYFISVNFGDGKRTIKFSKTD